MREIKFRGWCDKDSEWREGFYVTDGRTHEIQTLLETGGLYCSQVDPESVGQFTGVYDIDGNAVYEGDITDDKYVIEFKCGAFLESRKGYESVLLGADSFTPSCGIFAANNTEVGRVCIIGNYYENPELLED